jgi:hypothetical protein
MRRFLKELQRAGILDSAAVIVHSDHGSRIRLLKAAEQADVEKLQVSTPYVHKFARDDYVGEPTLEDLLNRFSTLAAVKLPGAVSSQIIDHRASVLSIVWTALNELEDIPAGRAGLDSVYLFDEKGSPRAIPILDFWKEFR